MNPFPFFILYFLFFVFQDNDLTEPDVTIAAQPLLNGALNEDALDHGWVRIKITHDFLGLADSG